MNFAEVEIDKRYACEWEGHHYFATTLHKQEGLVLVKLSDRINADGEPDSPVYSLGIMKPHWVDAKRLHEL